MESSIISHSLYTVTAICAESVFSSLFHYVFTVISVMFVYNTIWILFRTELGSPTSSKEPRTFWGTAFPMILTGSKLNVVSIETGKSSRSVLTAFQRFWNFLMSLASLSAQLQQHFLTVPVKRLKLWRPPLWHIHRAEINKNHNEENLWPSPGSLINTAARAVLVTIKIPKKWHDDIIYLKMLFVCLMGWQAC